MSDIISVRDIEFKQGSKVFVRCDFNTPMDEFCNITDDRRIRSAIPTIRYILDSGCGVILASHLGRPKNGFEEKFSLAPVAKRLSRLLDKEVIFASDVTGADAKNKVANLKAGEILLLENLRFEKGETKDDENLAKRSPLTLTFLSMTPLVFATARTLRCIALRNFLTKITRRRVFC